mmetsp:Transcript_37660/g.55173  ORF Transcript_37660/g.55173 Transcript_37660/m.55173 type:complete len:99 (-) Transcript_37660:71-367(-)
MYFQRMIPSSWQSLPQRGANHAKKIEPFYQNMALKYDAHFVRIDVDELDEVAQECNVSMMPTFVIMKGGNCKLGSLSGTNEDQLEQLISQHCPARERT